MKKYIITGLLIICIILALDSNARSAYFVTAIRSDTTTFVNGRRVVLLSYNINGSRYMKIRDLAYTLSGTSKQFSVGWSGAQNAILLTSGKPYKAVGGEMSRSGEATGMARISLAKVLLDGNEVSVYVYNYKGENYYRLRDIGRIIDFNVGWDSSINAVIIDTSKRSTDKDASPNPFIARIRNIDPSKPMVALTFDDGPGAQTNAILDILERHNAKATFFVLGNRVSANNRTISRAYNMGCEIAGHAWSHRELTALPESRIRSEIHDTNRAITSATGAAPTLLRPPYGSVNSRVRSVSQSLGVPIITWSIDTRDWSNRNANTIYNNVMRNVRNKDIILLHDTYSATTNAISRIVPDLISRGYQLVTVSELMYFSGMTPDPGAVYFRAR